MMEITNRKLNGIDLMLASEAAKHLAALGHEGAADVINALIAVGELIASGTHVVVPVEPDAPMLQTADDVLKAIYQDDHQRSEVSFMWMKVHRAVTRAMIAASK